MCQKFNLEFGDRLWGIVFIIHFKIFSPSCLPELWMMLDTLAYFYYKALALLTTSQEQ